MRPTQRLEVAQPPRRSVPAEMEGEELDGRGASVCGMRPHEKPARSCRLQPGAGHGSGRSPPVERRTASLPRTRVDRRSSTRIDTLAVDTLGNALRQWAAVPADATTPPTTQSLTVDIRRVPVDSPAGGRLRVRLRPRRALLRRQSGHTGGLGRHDRAIAGHAAPARRAGARARRATGAAWRPG